VHIGVGAGAMATLAPIYNLVQMPFLVQGQKHMAAIADGPVGANCAAHRGTGRLPRAGLVQHRRQPDRDGEKPVTTPADLAGVKIAP